ncbi:LuxR C-terminal-related transcriptional regulator [Noviluteimonas gilva]|uniref:AAA family ATPase n=1 Tax=Noviluteimonas gilva TaxID=2682097 RepID=A0A7C9LVS0_9GAMM|nr:LuxR C-terminal-related transcriptional regulator [Lysobacter gilvus]MUV12925.1 AAA family ATPase [Lysobacter gilvus]
MSASEILLKCLPPRMPRDARMRPALLRFRDAHRDCTALVVEAPAGYGKTTLLLQWRLQWQAEGVRVAWLTADEGDTPERFAMALQHAFDHAPNAVNPGRAAKFEAITELLAAIGAHGEPAVLIIDDAENLPAPTVALALRYLLHNAPANLRVAIGSRVRLPLPVSEMIAKGHGATLGVKDLRLTLDEAMDIMSHRLEQRLDPDECARLHDATEGWPLGLQLALAAIEREPGARNAAWSPSGRSGTLQTYFVESLMSRLSPDVADALVRASILPRFDVALFEALTGASPAGPLLEDLGRRTPILMTGEGTTWMRMHPLARDFLLERFERLPREEQMQLHGTASRWFAGHERFPEAAKHALASGDEAMALKLAARSLWALSTGGHLPEAREWIDRLPREMWERDMELRLVVGSVLGFGDRNEEAIAIAKEVLDDPEAPQQAVAAALRIAGGGLAQTDRLGQVEQLVPRWDQLDLAQLPPLFRISNLNFRAVLALHAGEGAQARALVSQQAVFGDTGTQRWAAGLGRSIRGLSLLLEGHPRLAEESLREPLRDAEQEGRRGALACVLSSFVACALFECGELAAARAMLADRLDVIERCGFPDHLICAYRTLARIAFSEGDVQRGLLLLEAFDALGKRRDIPRMRVHALAEQARAHAEQGRFESAERALRKMEAVAVALDTPDFLPLREGCRLTMAIAQASVALLKKDAAGAMQWLETADRLATTLNRGGDTQRVRAMRGIATSMQGQPGGAALMREAIDMASLSGDARVAAETRPLVAALAAAEPPVAPVTSRLLTTKEGDVLRLLDQGLSNKAIGNALDVSGETVKWHLKNLFAKLSATTRTQAVSRARLLGLLQG